MTVEAPEVAEVDFVMPVFNEAGNFERAVSEIDRAVPRGKRLLVVYDSDDDDTLPVVERLRVSHPWITPMKNSRGRGVLNAIRAGIDVATAPVVIVTMADLSDDLTVAPEMIRLISEGHSDVVCASRYMPGGRQIGGPRIKKMLSRAAGLSLHYFVGFPSRDATNAFRAYRRDVLEAITIESTGGFEYSLELTAKAWAAGYRIAEVPSTWRDRSAGQSRFRLMRWLPLYLRWYGWAILHRPRGSSPRV